MAIQVVFLTGLLLFIVLFRDFIAQSAGNIFGGFGSGDVQVERSQKTGASPEPDATSSPDASRGESSE